MKTAQKKENFILFLAVAVLFFYPFRHIFYGVDLWDTGYNYGNFMFMKNMDPMWVAGTFLGTALGNFFLKLPFGNYMWGMNFYTSLTISVFSLVSFWFFIKKIKLPVWIAFAGEFLTECLCWCPTALLYNYLTYVLWGLGCVFLYLALMEGDHKSLTKKSVLFFLLSGALLGLNVFTRLPNLAEMGMIVAVWAMAILEKKGFLCGLKQTLVCIGGYVLGLISGLLPVAVTLSLPEYKKGIERLLSMPGEASDYSLYSMVYSQLNAYLSGAYWLGFLLLGMLFSILVLFVCKKFFRKTEKSGTPGFILGAVIFVLCMVLYTVKKMYIPDYHNLGCVFYFAVFFIIFSILSSIVVIFSKNFDMNIKLLAGMGILIMGITPLGSNNHLYSAMNNLFLVAPLQLYLFRCLIVKCKEKLVLNGVCSILLLYMAVFMVQSVLFGATYVFTEATGGKNLNTRVENNDILKGMRTSPERAKWIEELTLYVEKENLKGKEVFLYGWIPSASYYLEMPFVFTPWPDLRSYNVTVMKEDFLGLTKQIENGDRELPVLLFEKEAFENYQLVLGGKEVQDERQNEKLNIIADFAAKYGYTIDFENEKFVLLIAKREN